MKHISIISMIVMIWGGCEWKSNPLRAKEMGQIVPLQLGNNWKYTHILYDSAGNEGSRWTEEQSVLGDTILDGETWYRTDPYGITYFANRDNGLWKRTRELFYIGPPGDLQEPLLDLPFPIAPGDSMLIQSIFTYSLIEKDVAVVAPAGTFFCYHYRVKLPGSVGGVKEYHRFYALNVGLIKETWTSVPDFERDPYGARVISWYSGESLLSQVELY